MRWRRYSIGLLLFFSLFPANGEDGSTVRVTVHADAPMGEFSPIWSYFGADEPNYVYGPHGRKLLRNSVSWAARRILRCTFARTTFSRLGMATAR
jgi:hypothetical protein